MKATARAVSHSFDGVGVGLVICRVCGGIEDDEQHAENRAARRIIAANPYCGVVGCPGGSLHAHDLCDWSTDARAAQESE